MKKNAHSLLAIILLVTVTIGTAEAQIGFHAGYVNSTFATQTGNGEAVRGDAFNGFEAGINNTNKIIGKIVSVKYGLNYTYLTSNKLEEKAIDGIDLTAQTTNHYLDIPVHLQVGIPIAFIKVFVYGGPKFVMGLSSKTSYNGNINIGGLEVNDDFIYNHYNGKIGSDDLSKNQANEINEKLGSNGTHKRFDILAGVGVGVELFKILTVKGGYDWGLLNLAKADNATINRDQFNITIGISF